MTIYVARDGETIGEWSLEVVRDFLSSGYLLDTDYGWHEEAPEWLPLGEVISKLVGTDNIEETRVITLKDEVKASPKQLAYLEYHGVDFKPDLTRGQAKRVQDEIVNSCKENPSWETEKFKLYPEVFADEIAAGPTLDVNVNLLKKKAQKEIHDAKEKIVALKLKFHLDSTQSSEKESIKAQIRDLEEIVAFTRKSLGEDIHDDRVISGARVQDWTGLFAEPTSSSWMESSLTTDETLTEIVKNYNPPEQTMVEEILAACDRKNRHWENKDRLEFLRMYEKISNKALKPGAASLAKSGSVLGSIISPLLGKKKS